MATTLLVAATISSFLGLQGRVISDKGAKARRLSKVWVSHPSHNSLSRRYKTYGTVHRHVKN